MLESIYVPSRSFSLWLHSHRASGRDCHYRYPFGGGYSDLYEQGTNLALAPIDFFSAGSPLALRGTAITSGYGPSLTLALPAGTQAGDLAVVFAGAFDNLFSLSTSGWTTLNNVGGAYVAATTYSKVLTSSDISAGSITLSIASYDEGVFAVATMVGSTGGIRETDVQRFGGGFSSPVTGPTTSGAVANTDAGLYFTWNRGASTDTIDHGTLEKTTDDGSLASAVLNFQLIPTSGAFTPNFSYTTPGSGYYQSLVIVEQN